MDTDKSVVLTIKGFSFPRKVGRKSNEEKKNILKFFVTKGKFIVVF